MDIPVEIPPELARHRAGVPEWLAAVPEIVRTCAERWALRVGPPFHQLSFNYAAPAKCRDGRRAVLKICPVDAELLSEIEALRHFDGRGMVRILEADEASGAMLLEALEPGQPIITLEDDAEATAIALSVMQRFWLPPPASHRFPSLGDWFERAYARHRDFYGGPVPFDPGLFARTESLYRDLLASSDEPVLLHGDLNYGNVLSATREPWLGIDPKGIIGERVFDTAILLHDPADRILGASNPDRFLARRVDQIVDATGFDRDRVVDWGIAYAVLSALWSAEDGGTGWHDAHTCAEILERLQ